MQNHESKRNSEIVLPENLSHQLKLVLASLPDGNTALVDRITSGYDVVNHMLLIRTSSNRYVFRARQEHTSLDVSESYMRAVHECTGFLSMGGDFKLRTISEEVNFMKQALALGLPVPRIISADTDWMLIEYIEGQMLYKLLEAGEVRIFLKMLQELHLAHEKGIIYGDRWGGNEIVESGGNIHMIDFDSEWLYEGNQPGILENLEMANIIFHSLRVTTERDALLELIELNALPMLKAWGYQLDLIKKFIAGFCDFCLNPNKPNPSPFSLPSEMYLPLYEPANYLLALLS